MPQPVVMTSSQTSLVTRDCEHSWTLSGLSEFLSDPNTTGRLQTSFEAFGVDWDLVVGTKPIQATSTWASSGRVWRSLITCYNACVHPRGNVLFVRLRGPVKKEPRLEKKDVQLAGFTLVRYSISSGLMCLLERTVNYSAESDGS